MFDGLRHDIQIRRLQKRIRRVQDSYAADRHALRIKGADADAIESVNYDEMHAVDELNDDILETHHRYVRAQAGKWLVPVPEFKTAGGAWEESQFTGKWRLTEHALAELRSAIRKEQKEYREAWQGWLTPIIGVTGALTGLVGATIALLSFLHKM